MSTQSLLLQFCRRYNIKPVQKVPITSWAGSSSLPSALRVQQHQQQQPFSTLYFRNFEFLSSVSILNQLPPRQQFYSTNSFHKYNFVMDAPPGVFRGSVDRFNGITVQSQKEFEADVDIAEKLKKSLEHWSATKRRAIWFNVETKHSAWIPHLTENGFEYHHANKGYVVLNRWLPEDESVNIPNFAHTMIGVGGLVVNEKNEILVVCERYTLIPNSWKLPGGYVEPRENFVDAAIREVREETGIDCEFKTVISIRHSHGGGFGCSDLYIVIGLTPKTLDLKRDEREIAKLQWMPVDEYLQHPNVHETNRFFARTFLDYNERGICFTWEMAEHQILKKKYSLYYIQALEEGCEKSATGVGLEEAPEASQEEECKNKL